MYLPDNTVYGAQWPIDESVLRARLGSAFREPVTGGQAVLVPAIQPDGSAAVVRVFVTRSELTKNVATSCTVLALLGGFLILVAVVVADRMGRSIVVPVENLSRAAHRLAEGDLDTRVRPDGPPEVVEVGTTFNLLASRIERLLQQERESAADLSHRLRTPLTTIRLDVEALGDTSEADRLREDVDELERTIDHVIQEARRGIRSDAAAASDLVESARARSEFWGALADEQGRPWHLAAPEDITLAVKVPVSDLEAAIDALIGNVFAHTAEGVGFRIEVSANVETAVLSVEDEGAGFEENIALARGASGTGSTGLGLDIVRRTAEASGGSVHFKRGEAGGARIEVEFGLENA